jgi:lipoate-protein ligase A
MTRDLSGPPPFGFVTLHEAPLAQGIGEEAGWLARVAETGRPAAHLWRGPPGFVVPRSYERRPKWAEACAASAAAGWPVQVRASGGGLVPQGPGVLNLSLGWRVEGDGPADIEGTYRAFTAGLAAAFERLGVHASAQPVEGSFCDGRFNLAVDGRKIVGTAQAWRRIAGRPVVLSHAVIVATADPSALTEAANRFEALSGGSRRYRAEALASLVQAWARAHPGQTLPARFERRVEQALAEHFARVVPPNAGNHAPRAERGPGTLASEPGR